VPDVRLDVVLLVGLLVDSELGVTLYFGLLVVALLFGHRSSLKPSLSVSALISPDGLRAGILPPEIASTAGERTTKKPGGGPGLFGWIRT
jgi:hypothetical protein